MHPDTLDSAVLRCPSCKLPSKCLCLPDAFTCRDCGAITPFAESRKRRKIEDPERRVKPGSDDPKVWKWVYYRSWQCKRCFVNENARSQYRRTKKEAGAHDEAAFRRRYTHPLWKWVKQTKALIATVKQRQAVCARSIPPRKMAIAYYEQYVRFLWAYVDHIEGIIEARKPYAIPGASYAYEEAHSRADIQSYPDELQPTSHGIHIRLPIDRRKILRELAQRAHMPQTFALWSRINTEFPRSAPDSNF